MRDCSRLRKSECEPSLWLILGEILGVFPPFPFRFRQFKKNLKPTACEWWETADFDIISVIAIYHWPQEVRFSDFPSKRAELILISWWFIEFDRYIKKWRRQRPPLRMSCSMFQISLDILELLLRLELSFWWSLQRIIGSLQSLCIRLASWVIFLVSLLCRIETQFSFWNGLIYPPLSEYWFYRWNGSTSFGTGKWHCTISHSQSLYYFSNDIKSNFSYSFFYPNLDVIVWWSSRHGDGPLFDVGIVIRSCYWLRGRPSSIGKYDWNSSQINFRSCFLDAVLSISSNAHSTSCWLHSMVATLDLSIIMFTWHKFSLVPGLQHSVFGKAS